MPHGPTYFETKGKCIYCGVHSYDLTDEHIVPKALGGQHVIRAASCAVCSNITTRFERKVARDLWGDARISFNSPSYRKNKRPDFITVPRSKSLDKMHFIASAEYPAIFVFYKMESPGFLQGLNEFEDISVRWKMVAADDNARRKTYFKKYENYPVNRFKHIPQEFGQMIAKIGYGQILTTFHPSEFLHICLPYILGKKSNVSFIVGCNGESEESIPDIGYLLETEFIASENFDRMLLIAKIRLYANLPSPTYSVVVGELIGKEKVAAALDRHYGNRST